MAWSALLAVGSEAVESVRLDDLFANLRIMEEARARWANANSTANLDGAKLQILLRGHL